MEFPNYFADADAPYTTASYLIYGIPYEQTSSFRHGAHHAPKEIRQASWNYETYNIATNTDLTTIPIHDYGNLTISNLPSKKMIETVTKQTNPFFTQKKIPIALGGDHSITPGIIKNLPQNTIVLSLDAHLDYRNSYENDIYNHACVNRRISEHLHPSQIHVIGFRSAEKTEFHQAQKDGIHLYPVQNLQPSTISHTINTLQHTIKNAPIYLTIDIDVIDPAYAPATSTPEPFGITPQTLLEIIDPLIPQLIGCDLVEVCPPYDHGQTALLAAKIIRHILHLHSLHTKP